MNLLTENMEYVLLALVISVLLLVMLWGITFVILLEQKKKYEFFMGSKRRPSHNLEMKIEEYFKVTKKVEENYNKILDMVLDIEENMRSNVQKVGLVRYNPFDEMGGNLCFALALLDQDDNGVVLNGIHSRTGSFTYAKPIQMGVSIYLLSDEEVEAVEMAKNQTYQPKHEKIMKIKFRKKFKKRDKDKKDKVVAVPAGAVAEDKKIKKSLGDVSNLEKEQILMEEQLAGKIASVDAINEDYYDELYPEGDLVDMEDDFTEDIAENLDGKEPIIEDMEEKLGYTHTADELHEMAKELAAVLRMEEVKRKKEEEELAMLELGSTNLRRKVRMEKRVLVEVEDTNTEEKVAVQDTPIATLKEANETKEES